MDYWQQRGPTIRISFDDAAGIQAEKTQIRFRGVAIGIVKKVSISEDSKNVIAEANLYKDASEFAVAGSKFWVVLPKVNFQGVSGLETLFEGTYIAIQPGDPSSAPQTEFVGHVGSGSDDSLEEMTSYTLETSNAESVSVGDTVSFRGFKVGSVGRLNLSKNGQSVLVNINIENRYIRLIRENTVFWRKVGVSAKLGLFNSELKINSLDSILRGGIEISTPPPAGAIANAGAKFLLYESPPKDFQKWSPTLEF